MNLRRGGQFGLLISWLLVGGAPTVGDDASPKYTVRRGPFSIEVALEASVEPTQAHEVVLRPEDWKELTIEEVAPHGAAVRQGETLLLLDRRKYQEAVKDQEFAAQTAGLAAGLAKAEWNLLLASNRMEQEESRRLHAQADEDLRYFLLIGRSVSQRQANLSVKSSEAALNFALDELNQLEKMYQADHLTEETEEIILKRQREQVEQSREHLELSKIGRDRTMEADLPRREQELRATQQRMELAHAKADVTMGPNQEKKQLEMAKASDDLERAVAKLNRLKADASWFKITAPADGIVYHGGWVGGQYTGDGASKLRRGAALLPNETVLTVVSPRVETVRMTVAEKELPRLAAGLKGYFTPTGRPDVQVPATVKLISSIPTSAGKFSAQATLAADQAASAKLVPGMSGIFRAMSYYQADAVTVPLGATGHMQGDLSKPAVALDERGSKMVEVKLGRRNDQQVELIEGPEVGTVLYSPASN